MLRVWSPVDEEDLLSSYDVLPNTVQCKSRGNVRIEVQYRKEYKNNEYGPIIKTRRVVVRAQYAVSVKIIQLGLKSSS